MLEVILFQDGIVLAVKAFNTVHKADNLSVTTASCKSQQAIDNVVGAGSLSTQVDETNLLLTGLVCGEELLVQLVHDIIAGGFVSFVCQKLILHLNEVG